jgi:MYXO-CTERM domain-containing protein
MRNPLAGVCSIVTVVGVLAFAAAAARADLAPPDMCTAPNQPCQNAGPQYNRSGICVATTCTKQVPAADGGMTSMTYDCNRCEMADGGAGGAGGSGGGDGGPGPKPTPGSSGCAVSSVTGDGENALPGILLLAGLALAASRRRTSVG